MKKLIASIIALVAINASAYDVTNTVTIVSNIYNRISEEHWITNNIKNTHTNYHYTNNVYTVSNVTLLVSQQTFKTNTTVNLDVSQQAIAEARAQANRAAEAATNANDFASSAASSATTAQSHSASAKDYRDEAEYYANQAHGQVQPIIDEGARQIALVANAGTSQVQNVKNEGNYQVNRVDYRGEYNVGSVNNAGTTALNNITAKQQWFEDHFGEMVTNVYIAEDDVAREMANSAKDTANSAQATANSAKATANDSIDYTTSVSNRFELRSFIYNDGTGLKSDKIIYKLYYSGILEGVVSVDPKDPDVEYGSYETWNYKYTVTSGNIRIDGLYKMNTPPNYVFRIEWARTDISGPARYAYVFTRNSDKNTLPTGSSTSPSSYGRWESSLPPVGTPYIISSDFNVYDLNSNKIGRIMRDIDLSELSNWVERVFMKK